jgi:hypothetical protein
LPDSLANLSADGLGDSRLLILQEELQRGDMLAQILSTLYNITTTISFSAKKRASGVLAFNFSGCTPNTFDESASILLNMTDEIFSGGASPLGAVSYTLNYTACSIEATAVGMSVLFYFIYLLFIYLLFIYLFNYLFVLCPF